MVGLAYGYVEYVEYASGGAQHPDSLDSPPPQHPELSSSSDLSTTRTALMSRESLSILAMSATFSGVSRNSSGESSHRK